VVAVVLVVLAGEAGELAGEEAEDTDQALTEGGADPVTCLGLPASTTCPQFLTAQLKQVDIDGLIDFIHDSIDAAQTCSDPHKSLAEQFL
jgi:hypothetical protein